MSDEMSLVLLVPSTDCLTSSRQVAPNNDDTAVARYGPNPRPQARCVFGPLTKSLLNPND